MTFKEAKEKLRVVYKMTLKLTPDHEFRVNFIGAKEASAYYATDLDDAFTTAIDMRLRMQEKVDPKTLLPRTPFLLSREAAIRRMAKAAGVKLEEIGG